MTTPEFVPYLSVTDADEAVAFYSRVFAAEPSQLLNMPDGRIMHCEFRIGSARFMPWRPGLFSDSMSLTMVSARQYNGGSSHALSARGIGVRSPSRV